MSIRVNEKKEEKKSVFQAIEVSLYSSMYSDVLVVIEGKRLIRRLIRDISWLRGIESLMKRKIINHVI